MANHSSHLPHMNPRPSTAPIARSMTFLSPTDVSLGADMEVHLKYGAHSNRLLFTEYGFVLSVTSEAVKNGRVDAEIEISDILEELFSETHWDFMKHILETEHYWG